MGEQYKIIEYSLIILFIITGSVFLISTSDLVSIFLSIELQSYGLYLLSTIYRDSEPATSGGLMYFLLGGLSSCFILLGTALLYANSGTTNLDSLYIITSISNASKDDLTTLLYWYKSYYIHISLLYSYDIASDVVANTQEFFSAGMRMLKSDAHIPRDTTPDFEKQPTTPLHKFSEILSYKYKKYKFYIEVAITLLIFITINCVLYLNAFYSWLLICIIVIILFFLHRWYEYSYILDSLGQYIFISIYCLSDLAISDQCHSTHPEVSHIFVFFIHLYIARLMYQNLFSIEKISLWDILKLYIEFFSKNPLLCIILITLLFLFCFGINRLFIWSLGLEINPESLSSYYIFVYTRLTYVSAMFFVFMLLYTPNREWNKVIGISVWIPLVSFNISLIHCFFLSPFPIKEVIADNIKAGITWLDDSWYEFRLAIYCIGSDLYNILTSLWLVLTTHIPSFTKILVTFPFFRRPFEILAIFYDYLVKVKLDQSRIHVAKNCGEFVYLPYKYTYYPLTEKLSKFTKIQIFDIIPNNDELYYNSFQLAVNSLKKNINILGDFCFTYNNSTHILSIITNMDVFDTYNNSVKSLGVSTELDLSKKSVYVYNKDLLREPLMNWCEKWILENTGWDKDKDLRISPKYPTYIFYSPKNQIILA